MQKRHRVPHFFVPTDQHTPEARHPAVCALHHPPPGPKPGFLLQCLGLFPAPSEMGGAANLGEQSTDCLIVIAFVQTHPLRRVWGRLRPLDGAALDGLPCHLDVMAVGTFHCEADRHAAAVGEYTALGPGFAPGGGVLAPLFPPKRGFGHRPGHGQPLPVNAVQCVVVSKAQLPPRQKDPSRAPFLKATMGGTTGAETRLRPRMPLAAGAEYKEDGIHGLAIIDAGPMAAQRVGLAWREHGRDAGPQFGGEPPITPYLCVVIIQQCGSCGRENVSTGYHHNSLLG